MRTSFVAFGAYLGRVRSQTECDVWIDDPVEHRFSEQRLVTIDLARTPSAAIQGDIEWSQVQVEDHLNLGGLTELGPLWPEGKSVGSIYLARTFLESLPSPVPTTAIDGEPYELESVAYHPGTGDPRQGRRYHGFHAIALEWSGSRVLVDLYRPGTSRAIGPMTRVWIDLDAVTDTDAGPDRMTTLSPSRPAGALFVACDLVASWRAAASPRQVSAMPTGAGLPTSRWREAGLAAAAALSLAVGAANLVGASPSDDRESVRVSAAGTSAQSAASPTGDEGLYCTPTQVLLKLPASCGEG